MGGARQAIQSNELDAQFSEHAAKGTFQLDVAGAKGGDGTQNPFTSGSSSMNNGGEATTAPKSKADKVIIAHGMLACLAISSSIFFML